MDEVTQQNAALVEEAAAAAQSLEDQAGKLRTAVAVFQLDENGSQPSFAASQPARRAKAVTPATPVRRSAPARVSTTPPAAAPAAPVAAKPAASAPSAPAAAGSDKDWETF